LLQGKLSQAPISTFQAVTAAAGNAAGTGNNAVVHRLPQAPELPGQLFGMQAVSLVPATQGEAPEAASCLLVRRQAIFLLHPPAESSHG